MQRSPRAERAPAEASTLTWFLDQWVAKSPPELVEAARCAALPHSFDLALLGTLLGRTEDVEDLVARLERAGLLEAADPGFYALPSSLRDLLLRRWWQSDPESYRLASARAAEFYRLQPASEAQQLEYIYHQLGADDDLGLAVLAQAVEAAFHAHQLGLAERLLQYADEQAPVLGAGTRAWLDYYGARLDLAHDRFQRSEDSLKPLLSPETDAHLRARAHMGLAGVMAATQRWTDALDTYAAAHDLFLDLDDPFNAARALEARGLVYLHLASGLGGIKEGTGVADPRLWTLVSSLQYAPFRAYRWFSRRVSGLPNLYFGGDYQDWIIYRILFRAIGQFEQAAEEFSAAGEAGIAPVAERLADVQIHLADLYHRVERWALAEERFRMLVDSPPVGADEYRRATLQLAQGRAALAESDLDGARQHLQGAQPVFARYGDRRALATTARLQGEAEVAAGNVTEAVRHFSESADASLAVNDLLASTHVWVALRKMGQRFGFPSEVQAQVDSLEQRLDHRAYIMRFRGKLLQQFRTLATRLAAYVVLPVTYLLMSALHLLRLHWAVIGFVGQIMPSKPAILGDLVTAMVLLLAGLLPAIWLYALFYAIVGWVFVRRQDLGDIAQLQTEFVATVPEGMTARDQGGQVREVPWPAVEAYVSANRAIWRRPISLFSRLFVVTPPEPLVVDGIARHYSGLQRDIMERLEAARGKAAWRLVDFSLLRSGWTVVVICLAVFMTLVSVFDWLDPTCRELSISVIAREEESFAYVSTAEGDLHVVAVWEAEKPDISGTLKVASQASDVVIEGGYAYVAAQDGGLRVIDVSDRTRPTEVGFYDTPGLASGLAVAGGRAYIADGTGGLRVVDITQPSDPVETGFCDLPGQALDVAVTGHTALVAAGTDGLLVVSVRDPEVPTLKGALDTPGQALAVAARGDYAYIADGAEGLRIVSIKDPAAPVEVGKLDGGLGQAEDVVLARGYAYVAAGAYGLHILHLGDPASPVEVGAWDTPGDATGVAVTFGEGYVADGREGLRVVNAVDPCDVGVDELGHVAELGSASKVAAPEAIPMPIASVTFELAFWTFLFLPIAGLARLLRNRAALRRIVGKRLAGGADWPIWLALLLLVAVTVVHTLGLTL